MTPARQILGEWSDSCHVVHRLSSSGGTYSQVDQAIQKHMLCYEFTSQGVCSSQSLTPFDMTALCAASHALSTYPKTKGKAGFRDGKGGRKHVGGGVKGGVEQKVRFSVNYFQHSTIKDTSAHISL